MGLVLCIALCICALAFGSWSGARVPRTPVTLPVCGTRRTPDNAREPPKAEMGRRTYATYGNRASHPLQAPPGSVHTAGVVGCAPSHAGRGAPRRRRLRRRRGEEGASLVEFALVLPIFALFLFGMTDFGAAFQSLITLRSGVNAGARLASVNQMDSSCASAANPMQCTIQHRIGTLLAVNPSTIQVAISFPGGASSAGSDVKVCGWGTLHSVSGFTGPILNGKVISAVSQIRLEQDASYTAVAPPSGRSC